MEVDGAPGRWLQLARATPGAEKPWRTRIIKIQAPNFTNRSQPLDFIPLLPP
jgi:hypothetical protein